MLIYQHLFLSVERVRLHQALDSIISNSRFTWAVNPPRCYKWLPAWQRHTGIRPRFVSLHTLLTSMVFLVRFSSNIAQKLWQSGLLIDPARWVHLHKRKINLDYIETMSRYLQVKCKRLMSKPAKLKFMWYAIPRRRVHLMNRFTWRTELSRYPLLPETWAHFWRVNNVQVWPCDQISSRYVTIT